MERFKKLMCRSLGGWNFLLSSEKVMVKDLISSGSLQNVSIICFVANSMEMKFWLEDIWMVTMFLSTPRFNRASAKSSLVRGRLCSFLKMFCMGRIDAVTVLMHFVRLFQGLYGWSNPRSSLLFVCMFSLVPSQAACCVILTKINILINEFYLTLLTADVGPSAELPGPNLTCLNPLVTGENDCNISHSLTGEPLCNE